MERAVRKALLDVQRRFAHHRVLQDGGVRAGEVPGLEERAPVDEGDDVSQFLLTVAFDARDAHDFACGDPGKPLVLLLIGPTQHNGCSGSTRARQRAWGQSPAKFFKHETQTEPAEIGPSISFRNDNPGPPH